ncbi:MAG: glycosyltransferase family 4 protein [Candidatus Diapherotrites archaeon]|nr:glycosyltransferase family 4 protein [Candidatus Diapherotrites archaeon]
MQRLAMLTTNTASRAAFFRAGGVRFIADLLPCLSKRFDIDVYVAGPRSEDFDFRGASVHIVQSRKIPFTDKRMLPRLNLDADLVLFLDYVAALSQPRKPHSAIVFHHLAQSFYDENPALYRRYFGRVGMRYLSIERFLLNRVRDRTALALAVSDVTIPYLDELGFRVEIVGNGVDTSLYRPAKKADYAVVVGRLVGYKRVEWALRVAERTGIPLKIVGTGPDESYLRRIAPDSVEFLGYVDENEKIRILSHARYLFAFSAFEGFDLPVIEAMASGTVPIMSDIRAHRFILSGNSVGAVVQSVADAVAAIRRYERDDELWDSHSRLGRRLVEELWSADAVCRRYLSALAAIAP